MWDSNFMEGLKLGSSIALKKKEMEAEKAFREYQMKQGGVENQLNQDKLTLDRQELATTRNKIMQDAWYKRKLLNRGVPVYTFGADGTPQMVGNVPTGSKVVTPASMLTPGQKIENEIESGERKNILSSRKDLNTWTSNATDAVGALNKIEGYARNLPQYKTGFGNQLWANIDANYKEFAKDPAFTEYLGVVSQELIPMARKLMEEKGPITEFDVNRVEKGFGDKTTPLPQRVKLISELRTKLQKAAKNKMQVSKMDEIDFSANYPDLYTSLFPEKASFIQKARDKGVDSKTISEYLRKK